MTDREQIAPFAWKVTHPDYCGELSEIPLTPEEKADGYIGIPLYTAEQMAAARIEGVKAGREAAAEWCNAKSKAFDMSAARERGYHFDDDELERERISDQYYDASIAIHTLDPETIAKERFND